MTWVTCLDCGYRYDGAVEKHKCKIMREIRFRAWDRGNKIMLYAIQKCQPNGSYACDSCFDHYLGVDSYVVLQYTGLHDKNGKEIYEGDIIHYLRKEVTSFDNDYERTFVIEWRDGGFWGKDSQIKIKDIAGEHSEIIGNIYENTKLLNQ